MSRKLSKFNIYLISVLICLVWMLLPIRIENKNFNNILSFMVLAYIFFGIGLIMLKFKKSVLTVLFSILSFLASGLVALGLILNLYIFFIFGKSFSNSEPIECISLENSRIIEYVTGGGATNANSVVIFQEMRLLPGIIMFKELHNEYNEIFVEMKLDKNKVLHIKGNSGVKLIQLSPFVYF